MKRSNKLFLVLLLLLTAGLTSRAEASRYYDPAFGRWTSFDPALNEKTPKQLLKLQNGKLFTQSPYNYSYNNPLRFADPDGKTPWDLLDIGFAAWSINDFIEDPSWENAGWAVYDVVAAVTPFLPSSKYFRAGGQIAESAIDAWGAGRKADKTIDFAKRGEQIWGNLKDGDKLNVDDALSTASDYLGKGYEEVKPGIFRSADGKRQVRMTKHDLTDKKGAHFNFEKGETITDVKGRKSFKRADDGNKHIFIKE